MPSPFIDIMMLSPALRTSQTAAWKAGSSASTTAPGKPRSAISSPSWRSLRDLRFTVLAGELDQQQRIRLAAHEALDGGAEHRDLARQLDHGAVHQLDRGRIELDDVLGRVHRLVEGREMADAEHLVRRDRLQLQLELGEERERALGADQQAAPMLSSPASI